MKVLDKNTREYKNTYQKEYLKRSGRKYDKVVRANGKVYKYKGNGNTKLNYDLLDDCGKGRKFEKLALSVLPGAIDSNTDGFNKRKWDLVWNGYKVDVKMQNIYRKSWRFTVKNRSVVDYFLFFGCIKDKPIFTYLVPSDTIKYDTFSITKNNFDLIMS